MSFFASLGFGSSNNDKGSEYCKLERGLDRQSKCRGCKQIEILFEVVREQERQGKFSAPSRPVMVHPSYRDLDICARKCSTCRVFRQALLLAHSSNNTIETFESTMQNQPVYIALTGGSDAVIEVSLGKPSLKIKSARVSCSGKGYKGSRTLCDNSGNPLVHQQASKWLLDCISTHTLCGNLRWSSGNPTRLVRILPDFNLQLVDSLHRHKPLNYIALSYCWGIIRGKQKSTAGGGRTTRNNYERRKQCFSSSELPPTIQDAIILACGLNIDYMWIDSVCIVQDEASDWLHEAGRMHEVYGNAALTLCISSNENAAQPLFQRREAWSYATAPCKLGDQWLTSLDMSLDEMRMDSPLSARGWTLQEERLSPRILFWSSQRMYWACSRTTHIEQGSGPDVEVSKESLKKAPKPDRPQASPQSFLLSCRGGQNSTLRASWIDIVESYTRRDLTKMQDRLPALSGLASRYHEAQKDDQYLAGLWRNTIAEDLCWSVITPRNLQECDNLQDLLPSWTWASLPLRTRTSLVHSSRGRQFEQTPTFVLIEAGQGALSLPDNPQEDHKADEPTLPQPKSTLTRATSMSVNIITKGASITHLVLHARHRRFWDETSILVPWSGILKSTSTSSGGKEESSHSLNSAPPEKVEFSFSINPAQAVYAVDVKHGRLLTYGNRKHEVIAQLDYIQDAEAIQCGDSPVIECIEVGKQAMVLVRRETSDDEIAGVYKRIGVSLGYRDDFFEGSEVSQIILV